MASLLAYFNQMLGQLLEWHKQFIVGPDKPSTGSFFSALGWTMKLSKSFDFHLDIPKLLLLMWFSIN